MTLRLLPWRDLRRFVTRGSKPPPMKIPLLMWYRRMVLSAFRSSEIKKRQTRKLLFYFAFLSRLLPGNTNKQKSLLNSLFKKVKSLSLKPAKALSLGANRVKLPSCRSTSVKPAASIRDKKILQHREESGNLWGPVLLQQQRFPARMCAMWI